MKRFISVAMVFLILVALSGCAKKDEFPNQTRVTSFKNGEFIVGEGKITAGIYNITPLDLVANVAIWRGNELRLNKILYFASNDEIENVKLKDGDRIVAGKGEIVFRKPPSDD